MDGGHASVDVSQIMHSSTECKFNGSTHNVADPTLSHGTVRTPSSSDMVSLEHLA